MAADPQDPARHAGRIVRRMLLRRNIAIDAETAQLIADAVRAVLQAPRPPGHHAGGRAPRPPAASRCSDRCNRVNFSKPAHAAVPSCGGTVPVLPACAVPG